MSDEPTPAGLTKADARVLTDQIKSGLISNWELIARAVVERAWEALGYANWNSYVEQEFGSYAFLVPREDRPEVVALLSQSGLSKRAIADVAGVSERTIRRDLATAANDHEGAYVRHNAAPADVAIDKTVVIVQPPTILGKDGKSYPRPQPVPASHETPPAAPAAPEMLGAMQSAVHEARRAVDKVARYTKEPHLRKALSTNQTTALCSSFEDMTKTLRQCRNNLKPHRPTDSNVTDIRPQGRG